MTWTVGLALAGGFICLVLGAEVLVQGATRLAAALGLSPLVIGLTVVAYGTSSPELAVSLNSLWSGQSSLAVGNIIGSCLFNVLLILGLSALITPLTVAQQLVRLDVPIMIGVSILSFIFAWDGLVSQSEGIFLALGGVAYTIFLIYQGRNEQDPDVQEEYEQAYRFLDHLSIPSWILNIILVAVGIALLILGSEGLVYGASSIARSLGVNELIIGLTVVALGTSLPELFTSIIASIRKQRDIAVGNVIGSNIFNILAVLGISSALHPDGVAVAASALRFDFPIMLAVMVTCIPIFFTGNIINRWEGMILLTYYVAYISYIVIDAANHDSLSFFSSVLILFIVPILSITIITVAVKLYKRRNAST